jgi:ELWxxDGT repeat protein
MSNRRSFKVRSQNLSISRKLGLESLESRQLLAGDFHLFKDINATPAPVGIFGGIGGGGGSAVIGGTYFFTAIDGVHGQELWKSDGTEAGTVLVKDIRPGKESSSASYFCELNGVLYFSANDGVSGAELWRSDGTEEGTFLVRDSSPDALGVYPRYLHRVGGTLVFESAAGWEGGFLWKSDGTEAGTAKISKPGTNSSPTFFGQNSTAILLLNHGALWRTDGTEEGTFMLSPWMGDMEYVGVVGETIYFARQMHGWPKTLWKSDGTVAGTSEVGSIDVGSSWSSGQSRVAIGETLLFSAFDEVHGSELWKLDVTSGSLALVKDIVPGAYPASTYPRSSSPTNFVAMNGVAYFLINGLNGISDYELWKSDGMSEGTVRVKQFPATEASIGQFTLSAVDDTLYFSVKDEAGNALWKSDGTEAGTVALKSINDGPSEEYAYRGGAGAPFKVGNAVLFFADDQNFGSELWRTDGTETGTGLVKDIRKATASSNASQLTPVGGLTFFLADDGVNGTELWTSDGTSAGTRLVKDITAGPNGTFIDHLTNVDGTLYFTTGNSTTTGALWRSDGSEAGTVMVKELVNREFLSGTRTFGNVGGTLYFSMNASGGAELWKSDGTEAGTVRVVSIGTNWIDRAMTEMTNVDGMLFFSANSGAGRELWKSDGTETGTVLVKDIFPGGSYWSGAPYSSRHAWLTEFNGQLLRFVAQRRDSVWNRSSEGRRANALHQPERIAVLRSFRHLMEERWLGDRNRISRGHSPHDRLRFDSRDDQRGR